MARSRVDLHQFLRTRSPAVVEAWYEAVKTSALASRSATEVRGVLCGIFDQVAEFLLGEGGSQADAEQIGTAFVALGIRPEAVGRIPQALVKLLMEDTPDAARCAITTRLPALVAGLTGGLCKGGMQKLLDEQEEIRAAYARNLRQALDDLRVKNAGIESSINGIVTLDLSGSLTYVNPAFLEMWGYRTDADVLGRHVSGFGEWRADIDRTLQLLSEQGGWIGELVAERADGSRFDVQASVTLVPGGDDHPDELMVFFVDITERKKTQEALRRRARQAAFLNSIGEEIAQERTQEGVLERAVRLAQGMFALHQVAVLLLDRQQKALVVAAVAGPGTTPGGAPRAIPVGEGITGWVAQHRTTAVVDDVSADPRYLRLLPEGMATGSELAVPIRGAEGVVGVLDVQSPVRDAFGSGERVVLETLADQIAVALENAQLYQALQEELNQRRMAEEALRRTVQRLKTMHEIDQAILGAKSKEEVAEAVLRNVRELVPFQRASINLLDGEAKEVIVIAALQTIGEGRAGAGTRFPLTQRETLAEMLKRRKAVYVKDLRRLPQSEPMIRTVYDEGIRSVLIGPITAQGELIGLLSLGSDRVDGFKLDHKPIVEELADTAGIAIQQARLFDSIKRQQERLRRTMARLAEVEEQERRRIVRELHDQVGQNLTALDLNLSLVHSQLKQQGLPQLAARLDDSFKLLEQTNERIRKLMIDLRPPVLDDYGLLSALHWYGDQFSGRTSISVVVEGEDEVARDLSPHVENAFFRIAQEALNNVAKHAQADEVMITLSRDGAAISLAISDDGRGFSPEDLEESRTSWGLLTMRERAESVGARCYFDSTPCNGARVVVEVPV